MAEGGTKLKALQYYCMCACAACKIFCFWLERASQCVDVTFMKQMAWLWLHACNF